MLTSPTRREAIALVALIALIFGGMIWRGYHLKTVAVGHAKAVAGLVAEAEAQKKAKEDLVMVALVAQDEANRAAGEAIKWEAAYRKAKAEIPVPEPLPPVADPDYETTLRIGLVRKGFQEGLTVTPTGRSILTRQDGALVWKWQGDAAMVPGLQSSLTFSGRALDEKNRETGDLRFVIDTKNRVITATEAQAEAQRKAIAELNAQVTIEQKRLRNEKWIKWGGIALAGIGGYALGRK